MLCIPKYGNVSFSTWKEETNDLIIRIFLYSVPQHKSVNSSDGDLVKTEVEHDPDPTVDSIHVLVKSVKSQVAKLIFWMSCVANFMTNNDKELRYLLIFTGNMRNILDTVESWVAPYKCSTYVQIIMSCLLQSIFICEMEIRLNGLPYLVFK